MLCILSLGAQGMDAGKDAVCHYDVQCAKEEFKQCLKGLLNKEELFMVYYHSVWRWCVENVHGNNQNLTSAVVSLCVQPLIIV